MKLGLFVREKLNEDHVRYLQAAIEVKADLTPIEVTKGSFTLVTGRHRIKPYRYLGHGTLTSSGSTR